MTKQIDLVDAQLRKALQKRTFGRLFEILTSCLPTTPPDLVENGINEYLDAPSSAYLFDDEIAVIPGQYDSFHTLGHFFKAGLIDSAVSLDLLLFVDEHINEPVYANAVVGELSKGVTLNFDTDREQVIKFEMMNHPMIFFGIRSFYEEAYLEALDEEATYRLNEDWAGHKKFSMLSISYYESTQTFQISKIIRLYLRSLTDYIRDFGTGHELARALYVHIKESVAMNPRLDTRFFHFGLVTSQAHLLASEDELAPVRRRLYEYVAALPNVERVEEEQLKLVKNPERLFDPAVRAGRVWGEQRAESKARVLAFPSKVEEQTPARASLPSCPLCESPMLVRENRRTRQPFLGCSAFPKCRHTQPFVSSADA